MTQNNLGTLYQHLNRHEDAEAAYLETLEIYKQFLGQLYRRMEKFNKFNGNLSDGFNNSAEFGSFLALST